MLKWILPLCLVGALLFSAIPSRSEDTSPTSQPSLEDRLAALESKFAALESATPAPTTAPANVQLQLRAALARITQLEQKVQQLQTQLASDNANPPRTIASSDKDAAADVLPKGTKLAGTYTNNKGSYAASAVVLSRDASSAVIRIQNELVTRDWEIGIDGTKAVVSAVRTVSSRNGALAELKNIHVSGTATADSISLSGNYLVQGPNSGMVTTINIELKVK